MFPSSTAADPTDAPATPVRPPFDPELATFLAGLDARGRPALTTEMLPRMRELEVTEEELDARLRERGLERRAYTVPGHLGVPIQVAVVQRRGAPGRHRASTRCTAAA